TVVAEVPSAGGRGGAEGWGDGPRPASTRPPTPWPALPPPRQPRPPPPRLFATVPSAAARRVRPIAPPPSAPPAPHQRGTVSGHGRATMLTPRAKGQRPATGRVDRWGSGRPGWKARGASAPAPRPPQRRTSARGSRSPDRPRRGRDRSRSGPAHRAPANG